MKKLTLYAVYAIGLMLFSSCNEFLDQLPDNRTDLSTKNKIAELLVTAYPRYNYIPFCEIMSDNAGDKGGGADVTQPWNSDPYFWREPSTVSIDSPTAYWDACYYAIAHANLALEAIDNAGNKKELDPQRGEALVCRAYAHFMLVSLFSKSYDEQTAASDLGIPYVTQVEKVVEMKCDRGNVKDVYAKIEKDLLEGIPLLSDNGYVVPKYHFTKSAAYAFASRFYLFKKDYNKVIQYSDLVLGANVTEKLRDWRKYSKLTYQELWQTYTQSSESSIILLQESLSVWGRWIPHYRYSLTADKRNEIFPMRNAVNLPWIDLVYGSEMYYAVPKFKEYFKQQSIGSITGEPYNMIPLFTSEEVFFNRLEALIENGTTADKLMPELNNYLILRFTDFNPQLRPFTVKDVNVFYSQIPTEKERIMACILDFKRADFVHEGLRWFDILRHKIEVVHTIKDGASFTLKADDPRRVLQVPSKAINAGLPSNPR